MQDHISVYGRVDQLHVHNISNMYNPQVRQYKQGHCSFASL